MEIQFFCPRWGSEQINWADFCNLVKSAGYDGIEYAIARSTTHAELDEAWNQAAKHNLSIIAQHYDTYEANFNRHIERYAVWLQRMLDYPAIKINSQTGKDHFSTAQNKALIYLAADYSARMGYPILHETHRNKFSYAAHITQKYLRTLPDLKITLDASHWVCVAESYLEDQPLAMRLAISRTEHLHARVGYHEGPQVTDPFLPEWEEALLHHLNWWDQVVATKRKENAAVLTITPEYGPYPYAIESPVSRKPLADQWTINVAMMNFLRNRYV
jgi:sugar phosphate isomerase/epimerase